MVYKYPICDVFHWFCKMIRFFATEPRKVISAGLAVKNEKVISCLNVDKLDYGYEFIEKVIQLPFKVPVPKTEKLSNFLTVNDDEQTSKSNGAMDKASTSEHITSEQPPDKDNKSLQNKIEEPKNEKEISQNPVA